MLFNGTGGEKFRCSSRPDAKNLQAGAQAHRQAVGLRRHRQADRAPLQTATARSRSPTAGMEAWLEKVMVEHRCPDCNGSRLKHTRLLFTINGKTIHECRRDQLRRAARVPGPRSNPTGAAEARRPADVLREITTRLELLLGIGLDYLNFNRRSGTLSGGESQRIRLSTQIGSGLMGMLYVLDEPSIGLHPKDNVKMIATLRRLRDLGNTVIVVEHDEDTIRAADHIVEMGPGPGVHGGQVVAQGAIDEILDCKHPPTGQYFSGAQEDPPADIAPPGRRPRS